MGFPGGSDSKESVCNAGDVDSISGLGRSPGEGNGYALQYSCLENPMDRWAWQATVHGAELPEENRITPPSRVNFAKGGQHPLQVGNTWKMSLFLFEPPNGHDKAYVEMLPVCMPCEK